MGLSNYLPNSRISQAGVVPNEASRPVSPYEGQVIYQTDTDRTLVWNGTAWVDVSTGKAERSGLVKIVPTDATNGTVATNGDVTINSGVSSVTVTNAFNSIFDNYLIVININSNTTSNGDLRLRLVDSGGSPSTTTYYSGLIYTSYSTGTVLSAISNNTVGNFQYSLMFLGTSGTSGTITLCNPNQAKFTTISSLPARGDLMGSFSGFHGTATAYPSFDVSPNSGTISGGTVRVYGYNQ